MSHAISASTQGVSSHRRFVLALLALVLVSWPTLAGWAQRCFYSDDLSCLLLVPMIGLSLLWFERREIFLGASEQSGWGVLIILLAMGVWASGNIDSTPARDNIESIRIASVVIVAMGAFVWIYGVKASTRAKFPLLFLFLMVPPPEAIHQRLVTLLQQGSTEAVDLLCRAIRVPAVRDGFVFQLRDVSIEVASQCSGIRSFIALLITALLLAHLVVRSGKAKAILVAVVLPFSIVKNGIRIAALLLLAAYVDRDALESSLHRFGGIPLFVISSSFLIWLAWTLRRAELARK